MPEEKRKNEVLGKERGSRFRKKDLSKLSLKRGETKGEKVA